MIMMMKLARINTALFVLIILVNGYVVAAPFGPMVWFWLQSSHTNRAAELTQAVQHPRPVPQQRAASLPNGVIIPAMLLDQSIFEGATKQAYQVLDKGIWRWPLGSTPDKGSNTILIGHRFTYTNPRGVFYFLDKVHEGDSIGVTWNNRHYIYRVANVSVVQPTQTSILDPTAEPTLTLYTCTPTWWPKDRLVVTAHLESTI